MIWIGWAFMIGAVFGWLAGTSFWRKKVKNLTKEDKKRIARFLGLYDSEDSK